MERPIGVFDSGVGGLTVLSELMRVLPSENFLYLGDTARFPYGTKSPDTVTRYSVEVANHLLLRHDIKLLVVACNTASSLSLHVLKKIYKIPVVGMVEPCVRRVASLSANRSLGVIGTAATIRSRAYEEALAEAVPGARVRALPCPLFVSLAEEGWVDHAVTKAVVAEYLQPFLDERPDALVLGCTHYPVLKGAIREFLGDGTRLIDSGEEAARWVDVLLSEMGEKARGGAGGARFLVTDDPERFARVGERILGTSLDGIGKVTL